MKKFPIILVVAVVLALIAFFVVNNIEHEDGIKFGNTTIVKPATVANVEADADDLADEVEDVIQGIIDEVEEEIEEAGDVVEGAADAVVEGAEDAIDAVEDTVEEGVDAVEEAMEDDMDSEDDTTEVVVENNWYVEYNEEEVAQALASDKKVVLFFHAGRCPSCIALDNDVNENLSNLDENTVLVKVDYDTAEELKAQYNVTAQHTLVVLDSEANAVTIDRGAATVEDVNAL